MTVQTIFGEDEKLFAQGMLERGFYPENVPPVFSVLNFYDAAKPYLNDAGFPTKLISEPSVYNASKRGGARRNFEVPNPTFYIDSVNFLTTNFNGLFEHFDSTVDSLSVPTFYPDGRPARITSHAEFHRVRRQKLAKSRFIVKTDISRFYHSIYTHSIPWALHGKVEAKKDREAKSKVIFGNRLDQSIRNANDGQTVGIPVGPDLSRYISEILGKAIDARFRSRYGYSCEYLRHVDDLFIGAEDSETASSLLAGIREVVRYFELDLNERKTSIVANSEDLEPFWPLRIRREIERFRGEESYKSLSHDFVLVLDEVVRIANAEKDDGVIKYALRIMDSSKIWANYWGVVEPFLVRSAMNFPHCWDYISRIVAWKNRTSELDAKLWGKVISKSLTHHARSGNDSEVCWMLWLAKELSVGIESNALSIVMEKCGALSMLLALDVFESVKHDFQFPRSMFMERIGEKPMLSSEWLLVYEAHRSFGYEIKTRLKCGFDFVSDLLKANAAFYDRDAIPSVFENSEEPLGVDSALEENISLYDGDHFGDDGEEEEPLF